MRAREFLREYKRDEEQRRLDNMSFFKDRLKLDPEFSLEKMEKLDPTATKTYVPKLVQWWLKGVQTSQLSAVISGTQEPVITKLLKKFDDLKRLKQIEPDLADINNKKHYDTVFNFISRIVTHKDPVSKTEERGKYKEYKTPHWRVIELLDEVAAKYWGKGAIWCTAGDEDNRFCDYNPSGSLFVIIPIPAQQFTYNDHRTGKSRTVQEKYQYWVSKQDAKQYELRDPANQDATARLIKKPMFKELKPILGEYSNHPMWKTHITKQEQIDLIKRDAENFKYIENPSEEIQIYAVTIDADVLLYIPNPSEAVQLAAAKQDGITTLRILVDDLNILPSENVSLTAIKQSSVSFRYLLMLKSSAPKLQFSDNLILQGVRADPPAIGFLENPSEELQLAAVSRMGWAIDNIIENKIIPSEAVQLAAVKNYGAAYGSLINADIEPSEAVTLAAVKDDPQMIKYVNGTPSEQVQLAAVSEDGNLIAYLMRFKPSNEVILAALRNDGMVISYLTDKGIKLSEEMKLAAVNSNGRAIRYIDNPSIAVQKAAIENFISAYRLIKNPDPEITKLYQQMLKADDDF